MRAVRFGLIAALVVVPAGIALSACGSRGADGTTGTAPAPKRAAAVNGYVKLARGVFAGARPELDRGPLEPTKRLSNLSVVFKLSPAQQADREALKKAQLDPASPSYRKWLTPEQYAARFGANPADIERTNTWLASQGLELHTTSRLGSRVTFSGTVANVQSAFRAPMRKYEVAGKMHYAMSASPQVPAELADIVLDVTNTHDFHPHVMNTRSEVSPDYTSGTLTGFAPPDWANVYDVTKAYSPGIGGTPITGAGVTIAVVGIAQIAQTDINSWRSKFGLPASTVTMTLVPDTGVSQEGSNSAGFEAVLDVEWTGGVGKGATINYVYTGADDGNVDDATYYIIDNNLGAILSESWGGCDGYYLPAPPNGAGLTAGDQNIVDVYGSAANLLGITYLAASGDSGATSCINDGLGGLYVNTPAAYPGVTAVGGTQFAKNTFTTGSDGYFTGYVAAKEHVWNEAHTGTGTTPSVAAGGGGISVFFSRPSYQSGIPTCTSVGTLPVAGVVAANMRQVPDVSFTAAGVTSAQIADLMMCTTNAAGTDCAGTGTASSAALHGGGGTSFATPAFAGVVAMMDQVAGGRLGNINPLLYALNTSTPAAFHDGTLGNNEVSCTAAADPGCGSGNVYGYAATTGYDCAVGLGSLDVYNLLTAMNSLTPTTTTLVAVPNAAVDEGVSVALTATVAPTVTSANSLSGGIVTFAFQSYDASGNPDINWGSWTLGTSALVGTTVAGAATINVTIPPGLVRPGHQSVDVYAMYGGDGHYFPSESSKVTVSFTPVTLAISPLNPHVANGATKQFSATGGIMPMKWFTGSDTTCAAQTDVCSTIDESTGLFTGGSLVGTTDVIGMDADGAYTTTTVTVGPLDGGTATDAGGSSSGGDSGSTHDAASGDASGSSSGGTGDGSAGDDSSVSGDDSSVSGDDDAAATGDDSGGNGSSSGGSSSGSSSGGGTLEDGSANPSDGGGNGGTGASSGCGCSTVGSSSLPEAPTGLAFVAIGSIVVARRRRRSSR